MTAPKTDRILALVAYLEAHRTGGVRRDDIARDVPGYELTAATAGPRGWETLRKRLRRDLDDIDKLFGIVVDYDEIEHRYRLRPPFFTPQERLAVIAAAAAVDVDGIDDEPALGELGAGVDARGQRIVLSVPARVRALSDAIRERRPVQFRYHGRDRTVDAYVIGRWRANWYVYGHEHESGERRKYRLDRIENDDDRDNRADISCGGPGSYEIPQDFDPAEEMRFDPNDWGHDPPVVAHVWVAVDHVHAFQYELGGRVVGRDPSSCVVELDVRHYTSFRDRLLGFGTHVLLLDPPELVASLRRHLEALAEGSP